MVKQSERDEKSKRIIKQVGEVKIVARELKAPTTVVKNITDEEKAKELTDKHKSDLSGLEKKISDFIEEKALSLDVSEEDIPSSKKAKGKISDSI